MTAMRKIVLGVVLLIVVALHVALFAAGGKWRTLGKVLVVVDIVSAWFVIGAVRETRKLEGKSANTDINRGVPGREV